MSFTGQVNCHIILFIVDPTNLQKKYAKKMQYLANVRDAGEKTIGKGCWMCDVVGCEVGSNEITPLAQELWSQNAPDFTSENEQVLSLVKRVRQATDYQGILVYDRGGDRREFLIPWTKDSSCHYLVRQRGDRNLLYRGKLQSGLNLAWSCNTPYSATIIKEKKGEEKTYSIEFGFVPVRLPEWPERSLWLVVVKGFGKRPARDSGFCRMRSQEAEPRNRNYRGRASCMVPISPIPVEC